MGGTAVRVGGMAVEVGRGVEVGGIVFVGLGEAVEVSVAVDETVLDEMKDEVAWGVGELRGSLGVSVMVPVPVTSVGFGAS